DPRDILRAGTAALLLTATGLHRREPRATTNVKRADALRAVELVRIDREQVDGDLPDVELERAHRLDRVAVEGDPTITANRADLGDGLDRPALVVRGHRVIEGGAIVAGVRVRGV